MPNNSTVAGPMEQFQAFLEGDPTGIHFLDIVLFGEFTIGNLIAVIIIIIVTTIVAKLVSRAVRRRLSSKIDPKNADSLAKLSIWIIAIIGLLIASPQLHIDLYGLVVAGGAITIALGFASQNTLSNLMAGVMLMIERPISFGDVVVINGTEGYVENISLISTHIKTYDGVILRIPNTTVLNADITNCVTNVARRFIYNVDISYSDDADKASALIRKTVEKHPYALAEPAPDIYVSDLGAHGIQIVVKIWAPSQVYWTAQHELLWEIFKSLRDGGIDIPFNQLVLWYGEENAKKLCENLDNTKSATEILHNSPIEGTRKDD